MERQMTQLSQDAITVLNNLRENAESEVIYKGEKWLCCYLDNARKGMDKNKFRAQLAVLAKAGLYRIVDGYAFGDVKEKD
jgi:hypothetical protein